MNIQAIKMGTAIVSTPLVIVKKSKEGWSMQITCKDGSFVEHEPFPPSLEGMVAAMSLAAEICAGKFFLKGVISTPPEKSNLIQIEQGNGNSLTGLQK